MLRFALVAALASLGVPGNAQDRSRPAECLLVVKAKEYIRGECQFSPNGTDGSFIISSYNGQYFAYVTITSAGVAEGYWNGEAYASHAHSPLGTLHRQDGCWVNDMASVCAY